LDAAPEGFLIPRYGSFSVNRRYTAGSGGQGRFEIAGVAPAPDYALSLYPERLFKAYFRNNPHELTGRVYDAYGRPRAGATVVLTWVYSGGDVRSVMERHTMTNVHGAFAIGGLAEGEHEFVLAAGGSTGLRRSPDIGRDPVDLILYLQ
jgi:hypothetical protein